MAVNDDDVHIRQYRPADFPQIRSLLFEGFVTSEGSVVDVALRRAPFMRVSLLSYVLGGAGLGLMLYSRSRPPLAFNYLAAGAGALLCAAGSALFAALRAMIPREMTKFCEQALASDMHDISAHYGARGGAFFVAARKGKAGDGSKTAEEVMGYVGLDYSPEKDPETAEVRRMIIAAKYRRHGFATRLMGALIAHGETIPGLKYLVLGTSDLQPAAQRLYERLGWQPTYSKTVGNWLGSTTSRFYQRPVGLGLPDCRSS